LFARLVINALFRYSPFNSTLGPLNAIKIMAANAPNNSCRPPVVLTGNSLVKKKKKCQQRQLYINYSEFPAGDNDDSKTVLNNRAKYQIGALE